MSVKGVLEIRENYSPETDTVIPYHVRVVIYSKIIYNDRLVTQMIQVMSLKINDLVREHTAFSALEKMA